MIEAASVGVPTVASSIYGLTDAVVDGVTGRLHEVGDVEAMASAMNYLAMHPFARREMGLAAQQKGAR